MRLSVGSKLLLLITIGGGLALTLMAVVLIGMELHPGRPTVSAALSGSIRFNVH